MLLGIDIGTSACKTTILDSATGRIVATARHPLNYLYPDSVRDVRPAANVRPISEGGRGIEGRRRQHRLPDASAVVG